MNISKDNKRRVINGARHTSNKLQKEFREAYLK
jgi:hypothetical protein